MTLPMQRPFEAAGLSWLAVGPGVLRAETKGGRFRRLVDCSSFRPGDPTGHHAKLFRLVRGCRRLARGCRSRTL